MILGALNWGSYITGLGILLMTFAVISLIFWIIIRKTNIEIKWR